MRWEDVRGRGGGAGGEGARTSEWDEKGVSAAGKVSRDARADDEGEDQTSRNSFCGGGGGVGGAAAAVGVEKSNADALARRLALGESTPSSPSALFAAPPNPPPPPPHPPPSAPPPPPLRQTVKSPFSSLAIRSTPNEEDGRLQASRGMRR